MTRCKFGGIKAHKSLDQFFDNFGFCHAETEAVGFHYGFVVFVVGAAQFGK
ncbi:MAG: hypothetical protein IJX11_06395 [Bacteroidales bacterium]|nr:hypothetical protein [Bacteroidales bacterium]